VFNKAMSYIVEAHDKVGNPGMAQKDEQLIWQYRTFTMARTCSYAYQGNRYVQQVHCYEVFLCVIMQWNCLHMHEQWIPGTPLPFF